MRCFVFSQVAVAHLWVSFFQGLVVKGMKKTRDKALRKKAEREKKE